MAKKFKKEKTYSPDYTSGQTLRESMDDPELLPIDVDFTLKIVAKNGEATLKTTGGVWLEPAVNILTNVIGHIATSVAESNTDIDGTILTEEQKAERKAEIFDLLNGCFSGVLRIFAPEIALRPNLTEDAMNKVIAEENRRMQETYDKAIADGRVTPKQVEEIKADIAKTMRGE